MLVGEINNNGVAATTEVNSDREAREKLSKEYKEACQKLRKTLDVFELQQEKLDETLDRLQSEGKLGEVLNCIQLERPPQEQGQGYRILAVAAAIIVIAAMLFKATEFQTPGVFESI